jgi:2-hydroxychromene-2-carboxylate isomerase/RimJ/RimL family protein N-acetyltransferase
VWHHRVVMSAAPIRVYFDFISPYAYLAWTQIHALAARHGRAVEPVPVLFAAMLDAWGHKGPAEIPPKRAYIFKDALRRARRAGVPLSPPPTHPFNPLLALRVASLPMDAATQRALITGLFRATWGGGDGVTDPAAVASIADAAGLDGAAAVRAAGDAEAKERVRAQTTAAIAEGAFGVPTLVVDGELFWGFDAFDHIDARLRGDDPIDDAALLRWRDLEASSGRRAVRPSAPVTLASEAHPARAVQGSAPRMKVALRPREPADDALHFVWQSDPAQVATTVPARARAEFDAWIAKITSDPAVTLRTITADGEVVGTINTFLLGPERYIGYRVANEHWGRGIGTEAVRLMLRLDPARPLFATVLASNIASRKVLARNGFVAFRDQPSSDGPEVVLRLG